MKKLLLIAAIVAAYSANAFAWKETGGGDEVALEFRAAFANALEAVKAGKVRGRFSIEDLERAAAQANIVVVNETLTVRFNELTQDSVAVNQPAKGLIKINRDRWNRVKNSKIQEAIALHEVLSLIGVERTGYYEISAYYLEQAGLSGWLVSGLGNNRVERPTPKTLSCEFAITPPGGGYTNIENISFSIRLVERGPGEPWAYGAEKVLTSKDGRYEFHAFGTQPFRTAYNPAAYEYITLSILDKKLEYNTTAGPFFPGQAEQNSNSLSIYQIIGPLTGNFAMINGKCSLN
jgi:hypothetical protein